jgi:hypothetical protein
MAWVAKVVAAISATDTMVILVICSLPMVTEAKEALSFLLLKTGQPWKIFHHALSTKRELLRSHPVTAAAMMAGECVGREIIRAVAVAAISDASTDRRTGSPQCGPVARQPGSRGWNPSVQNVQIGIIEREQAGLLDGSLSKCRRRRCCGQQYDRCKSFE